MSLKTDINLTQPSFVILLSETFTKIKNSFPTRQFATISTPESPSRFPATLSSLRFKEFDRHYERAEIPSVWIAFFLIISASRYFLFLRASPIAMAPFVYMML